MPTDSERMLQIVEDMRRNAKAAQSLLAMPAQFIKPSVRRQLEVVVALHERTELALDDGVSLTSPHIVELIESGSGFDSGAASACTDAPRRLRVTAPGRAGGGTVGGRGLPWALQALSGGS